MRDNIRFSLGRVIHSDYPQDPSDWIFGEAIAQHYSNHYVY